MFKSKSNAPPLKDAPSNELLPVAYADTATLLNTFGETGIKATADDIEKMHKVWLGELRLVAEDRALFALCVPIFNADHDIFGS